MYVLYCKHLCALTFYQLCPKVFWLTAELCNCLNCLWRGGKAERFMMKTLLKTRGGPWTTLLDPLLQSLMQSMACQTNHTNTYTINSGYASRRKCYAASLELLECGCTPLKDDDLTIWYEICKDMPSLTLYRARNYKWSLPWTSKLALLCRINDWTGVDFDTCYICYLCCILYCIYKYHYIYYWCCIGR